jgi:hypothetical protein
MVTLAYHGIREHISSARLAANFAPAKIQISAGQKGFKIYARKGYYSHPAEANAATRH